MPGVTWKTISSFPITMGVFTAMKTIVRRPADDNGQKKEITSIRDEAICFNAVEHVVHSTA